MLSALALVKNAIWRLIIKFRRTENVFRISQCVERIDFKTCGVMCDCYSYSQKLVGRSEGS